MAYKLEVAFIQGTSFISKAISEVSKKLTDNFRGNFAPSHVFLVLNDEIIFESSTYKTAGENDEKILEKGTRILTVDDRKEDIKQNKIHRCVISENCDPYLALNYVAKASNYHYSYKSILKFLFNGHLKKDNGKPKDEYICSGLVLDALREPAFKNDQRIQKIINTFKGIDSNSVTPIDLYMAFDSAGYVFKQTKGYKKC